MKKILFLTCIILFVIAAHAQNTSELWATSEHGGPYAIGSIVKMNLDGTGDTVVYDFFTPYPGSSPLNLIQASNGKLYGTTQSGGFYAGVLYSFDPSSTTFARLHDFDGSPQSNLIEASNGKLYGVTYNGGVNNLGTFFSFDPNSNTYSKIFDFGGADGTGPSCNLVLASDGKIYGTADQGGLNGAGVLFSMDPSTDSYTKLFDYGGTNGINQAGVHPGTLMQGSNGKLYGTIVGGGTNGVGVLFSFDLSSNTYSKLFDFSTANGASPEGIIMQASNGKLYGKTKLGGTTNGGVFYSFDPSTNIYSNIFGSYVVSPYSSGNILCGLIEGSGGKLYGTANEHGNGGGGWGVFFSYNLSTNTYSTLHNFSVNVSEQIIQLPNGKVYGISINVDWEPNGGTIFSFDPSTATYNDVHAFDKGASPRSIIKSSNGMLYGITRNGGAAHDGALFSFDPTSNTYVDQISFNATLNGKQPRGILFPATDGKLYGTTVIGGTNDAGVLYSFDPSSNTFQKLVSFDINNGYLPVAGLMQASNGKLYGMTVSGGNNGGAFPHDGGVIYSFDPSSSSFSKLFDFKFDYYSPTSTGHTPNGSLIQATNGKLYGMTEYGGVNAGNIGFGGGVIFSFDPAANTYAKILDLGGVTGERPLSDLMQASDGKLYGVTAEGGVNTVQGLAPGVLFSLDPSTNAYTKLYDFKRDGTGCWPIGNLIEAPDGKLYGTTFFTNDFDNGAGVIFSFDRSTSTYSVEYDFNQGNGANPLGKMCLGSDGKIYGKTRNGGATMGVVYSFDPSTGTYTELSANGRMINPDAGLNQAADAQNNGNLRAWGGNQTPNSNTSQSTETGGGILEVPETGIVANVTAHSFCPGPSFTVSYKVGYSSVFNPGNTFTAQLSDASGSFASPSNMGTVTSVKSGNIQATLPSNIPTGSGYRIRVVSTNPVLTGDDNGINLIIGTPVITASGSTTFCPGSSVVLKATSGNSYLWSTGATTQSITATSAGSYTVTVAACGTSAPVPVALSPGVTITSQPVSQTVPSGTTATFSVAATGTGLTYQWKKGSANLVNGTRITGTNTNTLSISFVTSGDASIYYKCVITASSGCSVTTPNTGLTVVNAAPVISSQPVPPATTPCTGGSVSFTVAATGSGLTYQWYKGSNPLSNGGNITGATAAALTINPLSTSDAANYSVVVTNSLGSATSNVVSLAVNPTVVINSQPQASQLVCVNNPVSFTVGATGNGLIYRWRKGTTVLTDHTNSSGSVISGTQTPTLTITNTKTSDAATNYNCQVIGCTTVNSANAALTVGAPATPGTITVSGGVNAGNTICPAGDTKTCSINAVSGASFYTWSVPSATTGVSINGGGTTVTGPAQSVSVSFSPTFVGASVVLSVVSGNTCANSAAKTVTFTNGRPAQPSTITGGSTSVCPGSFITGYQITNAGLTYNWTVTGDAVVIGSGSTASVTFGSVLPVTLSVTGSNACGTSLVRTLVINQIPVPATPSAVTGPNYGICANSTYSYSVTPVANVSYVWAFKNGVDTVPVSGNTNAVNVTLPSNFTAVSGILLVKAVNSCGKSSAYKTLTLFRAPATPAFISPVTSGCVGTTYSYTIHTVKGATSYLWYSTTSGSAVSITATSDTTANVVFNSTGTRNITVKAFSSCSSVTKALSVTVASCIREGKAIGDVTDFNVYPNPASNYVTLMYSTSSPAAYYVSLKDVTGREVLVKEGTSTEGANNINLNLDNLAHGVYSIILVSGDNRYQRKLTVK